MKFSFDKQDYNRFLDYLWTLQDLKYRDFHKKLILSDNLIGIRTPEIRRIAKSISKSDYQSFFKLYEHKLYEENLLHGLTLGYLELNFDELKPFIDEFLPFINNWAVCDMTAANLKICRKNKDKCFNEIKKYIDSDNYWINRFGYVLLLNYFVDEDYIDKVFRLCERYKDEYYVKMSIAWLISVYYVKYKDKTLTFLKNNKLDDWTYNKAIQKIIESARVSKEDKEMLKGMKRK